MTDLERGEWIKTFTGRTHSVDIWTAMLQYPIGIDNPEAAFRHKDINDIVLPESGIHSTAVSIEFTKLKELGMLARSEAPVQNSGVHYARTDSPGWLAVATTIGAVRAAFPSPTK